MKKYEVGKEAFGHFGMNDYSLRVTLNQTLVVLMGTTNQSI